MKIQLLGTGAAEGIPAFYSDTRVSDFARANGGHDVRMRAAALIDGRLKIDFGPDTLAQIQRFGLDAREWDAILFTHSHDDHFSVTELQYFLFPFSQLQQMPLPIFANPCICRVIEERYPDWPFELRPTASFRTFELGEYKITPIRAHHMDDEDAHNLIFQRDGKTILYGTDTGIWLEPTWEFLQGWKFDLMVLECTNGPTTSDYYGHLGIAGYEAVLDRLHGMGCLNGVSKVVSTHHSHNGNATHDELCRLLARMNVTVGYDGLEIEA